MRAAMRTRPEITLNEGLPVKGRRAHGIDLVMVTWIGQPQRRPPHEGEASRRPSGTRRMVAPSTKASPRRGGERDQLRRPLQHLGRPSTKASP